MTEVLNNRCFAISVKNARCIQYSVCTYVKTGNDTKESKETLNEWRAVLAKLWKNEARFIEEYFSSS